MTSTTGRLRGSRPQRMTAQVEAYSRIREGIIDGDLPPGTKLNQNELAAQLELSTTPVREALRRLAGDGLVQIDAYHGAFVAELDEEELREIYAIRAALEPMAIRTAIDDISSDSLDRAQALWERMEVETDPSEWVEANREFHGILSSPARSVVLEPILTSLRDRAAPYVRLSLSLDTSVQKRTNEEHRQILEAYRGRDADRAVELQVEHLHGTLDVILRTWHPRRQD